MKRLIFAISVAVLLTTFVTTLAESSEPIEFEPNLTKTLHFSSEEFMTTSFLRAAVTVFLSLDMATAVSFDERMADLSQTSFVGRDGDLLYIFLRTQNNKAVFIGYLPSSNTAMYYAVNNQTDAAIKMAMLTQCPDGYFVNEPDDISDVIDAIQIMDE